MRNGLSDSVRITWFDRERTLDALRSAVRELASSHPEIEAVILFGSLARGEAVPGSDADLLIILSGSDLPFLERIPRYVPSSCGLDVDVFPYTVREVHRMLREGNRFIKRALEEGIELYRRDKEKGRAPTDKGS